jgi:hypothetical protein
VGCPEQVINIPADWAAFFTVMLLSPAHFDWAKNFLSSQAWKFMIGCTNSDSYMSFALLARCPENAEVHCQIRIESKVAEEADSSPLPISSDCPSNVVASSENGKTAMGTEKGKGKAIIHSFPKLRQKPEGAQEFVLGTKGLNITVAPKKLSSLCLSAPNYI